MKRKPWHEDWRTSRDDYILRIYGWGRMRNIVRGYDVRFPRTLGFKQKYFSVVNYGSEQAALEAARIHRDELRALTGVPVSRRARTKRVPPFNIKARTNNKSGIVGVTYQPYHGGCWVAFYHPRSGEQRRRSWAVKKYTHEGAKMLAIMWRAEQIDKLRRKR